MHDLATITLEELKPAIMRALNLKRMAGNVAAGFMEKWRQALVEDIIQDKTDLEIAQALFRTNSLDQAIEQKERLYQSIVKPYLDETRQSFEDFMRLPWQEKYRIVIGNIFEQVTTAVAFHVAGRVVPIVRENLSELVRFISEDKPLSVVQTPEGFQFVFETTPEFGTSPEAASLMESEKPLSGSTKGPRTAEGAPFEPQHGVQAGPADIDGRANMEVAPAADVTLTEIAKDLKCDKPSALQQLKAYFANGVVKDNRIEAMIDADTKILFRKDFGEHAHPLDPKRGYPAGVKIDHYNIEIQERTAIGTTIARWNKAIANFHIVLDELGNVVDFYKTP